MPLSNPLGQRGRALCLAVALSAALSATLALNAKSVPAAPSCLGKKATIVSAKKTIVGKKAPDVIVVLGGGTHSVHGLGGNDRICGGDGEDRLYGEKGSDRIDGGGGDDTILGDLGGDTLSGGEGSDYIDGQKGSDEIDGGGDGDRLFGDKGNDTMDGGPGDGDELDGGLGDEKLETGGEGDGDIVIGNLGTDNLSGGPGNGDIIRGDGGIDTIDGGGGGQDIASFATSPKPGVVVSLASGTATGDGHDTLHEIDDVVGSPFDDQITGDEAANRIDGGPGNDNLNGGGPAGGGDPDQGFGGAGADACQGFGELSSCGDAALPQLQTAIELNRGLDGVSLVVTGLADDNQIAVAYNGSAFVVTDPTGVETHEGSGCAASGAPHSPIVPATAPSRTEPNGSPAGGGEAIGPDTTATCPSGIGVSFVLIDSGPGNDTVSVGAGIPGSLSVRISGGNGNDTISGGPGDDLLESGDEYSGTSGTDILNGEAGNDGLVADPGGDQLNAGDGNDLLVSSAAICQGHRFDGGGGLDTVSYARSKPPGTFVMELGGSGAPSSGCGGGAPDSILATSESLEGSEGDDKMIGDTGNNTLFGHGGADSFIGKGGSDSIEAIDGEKDKLIDCGPGADQGSSEDSDDPEPTSC